MIAWLVLIAIGATLGFFLKPRTMLILGAALVGRRVPAAQLDRTNNDFGSTFGGGVGVISHWAPGRFDNLRIESLTVR